MAIFACSVGLHQYPGRQQSMYPALVNGGEAWRRKLRLCPDHFVELQDRALDHLRSAQAAFDDPMLLGCAGCRRLVEDSAWQFFVTVYATGADRADYWAPVHEKCAPSVAEDWHLEPGPT